MTAFVSFGSPLKKETARVRFGRVISRSVRGGSRSSLKFVASYTAAGEVRQEFYISGRHVATSDIRASPHGLHPPSYNTWSSSCALYPRNYEGKIKHRHSRRSVGRSAGPLASLTRGRDEVRAKERGRRRRVKGKESRSRR